MYNHKPKNRAGKLLKYAKLKEDFVVYNKQENEQRLLRQT